MSDGFQQTLSGNGSNPVTVVLSGVLAASVLCAFALDGFGGTALSVADGQGTYSSGVQTGPNGDNCTIVPATLLNANSGSHSVTATTAATNSTHLTVVEVTGGSVLGTNSNNQISPGVGTDLLTSGSVTFSQNATAVCWSANTNQVNTALAPTVGTSPNAFTSRDINANTDIGSWRVETAAVSTTCAGVASVPASAGADIFLTAVIIVANGVPTAPTIASDPSQNPKYQFVQLGGQLP